MSFFPFFVIRKDIGALEAMEGEVETFALVVSELRFLVFRLSRTSCSSFCPTSLPCPYSSTTLMRTGSSSQRMTLAYRDYPGPHGGLFHQDIETPAQNQTLLTKRQHAVKYF